MKYAILASIAALSISAAAFASSVGPGEGTITGPGYTPIENPAAPGVSATEGEQAPTSFVGTCPEGTSPVLVLSTGDRSYSVSCETTPDYPIGG